MGGAPIAGYAPRVQLNLGDRHLGLDVSSRILARAFLDTALRRYEDTGALAFQPEIAAVRCWQAVIDDDGPPSVLFSNPQHQAAFLDHVEQLEVEIRRL